MISAWDVYWVMQLDSISTTVGVAGLFGLAGAIASLFIGSMVTDRAWKPSEAQDRMWASIVRTSKRMAIAGALLSVLSGFVPSTKTAATMIVLPAIVNNETLHKEAGELYGLAKQALKEAVGAEKAE
jgi:TctA family transporter